MQSFILNSFFKHKTCTKPLFLYTLLSPLSSLSKTPNPHFVNYLIQTFDFSQTQSLKLATRLKTLEKPQALLQYFQNLGFSHSQIQSSVRGCPQILFCDINNTLKPKIELFQQLGLRNSLLGQFFSKKYSIFTRSLAKLARSIAVLKRILGKDENNEALFKVLRKSSWLLCVDVDSRLLPNVLYFESCGIVEDKLSVLLKRLPRLFTKREADLRNLVLRVSQMGFRMDSMVFVKALIAVRTCNTELYATKVELFKRFGFSEDEYLAMVRKVPSLLNNSAKKSSVGLDFYLNMVKLRKEELIRDPVVLLLSLENRVMPRYRLLQVIKDKRLMKREPNFLYLVKLTEDVFAERFVMKFYDHMEELLLAYEGQSSDKSSREKMSTR